MFNITRANSFSVLENKILRHERITKDEALILWEKFPLHVLSHLAIERKKFHSGNFVFYNRNLHIEPTNYCIYDCKFCSFKAKSSKDGYFLSPEKILELIRSKAHEITEVHITGGVHPKLDVVFYENLFKAIKKEFPHITIKALTAVEIIAACKKNHVSIEEGLQRLKEAGLEAMPGGGAEIFNEEIRKKLYPTKPSHKDWLQVHETAHRLGIHSNATMLFGHVETISQRIEHLYLLRELQDKTRGFDAFIPLKFKNKNNDLSWVEESFIVEDLRFFAIARIFLDNFAHIKAYWPSLGIEETQISLLYGIDDVDGTINNSTTIYSRAGSNAPTTLSVESIQLLCSEAGFKAVERNTHYQIIKS